MKLGGTQSVSLTLQGFVTLSHTLRERNRLPVRSRPSMARHTKTKKLKKKKKIAACAAALAALVATVMNSQKSLPEPKHTSLLTGQLWLEELLTGHPARFQEQLGLAHHVFRKLSQVLQESHGLRDSRHVSADEQLAIFLHFARTGLSSRMLQERFQRSGDTISK